MKLENAAIRNTLKKKNMSQSWLAGRAGISRAYMTQLLNGQRRPSEAVVDRLGQALGLPRGAIVSSDDDASTRETDR